MAITKTLEEVNNNNEMGYKLKNLDWKEKLYKSCFDSYKNKWNYEKYLYVKCHNIIFKIQKETEIYDVFYLYRETDVAGYWAGKKYKSLSSAKKAASLYIKKQIKELENTANKLKEFL